MLLGLYGLRNGTALFVDLNFDLHAVSSFHKDWRPTFLYSSPSPVLIIHKLRYICGYILGKSPARLTMPGLFIAKIKESWYLTMLNDLDLISHNFSKDIKIYPVADVHLGAMEHAEEEWSAFLKKVKSEDAYLILAGDLLNNGIRSCKFVNPFEETIRPRDAKRRMVKYLEPVRDRILCVVSGNHERRTYRDDDQDLTYDICNKLDIEELYRENIAYMRIGIGERKRKSGLVPINVYTFAVTHGSGGGIYTGAAVNRDERFGNVIDGLDCLVTGHVHKGFVSKPAKIVIDTRNNVVKMTHYTVVSAVSWLNYGGYAARGMLLPAQVCDPQVIHLSATHDNKKITTMW